MSKPDKVTDMAAVRKRLVTQANSKLTKVNILVIMQKPAAWESLSAEAKERLYALLPRPRGDDLPHHVEQHPLQTRLRGYIETALEKWQQDLRDGRETNKFRQHKIETVGDDMPLEESEEGSDYETTTTTAKKKK